ncbi:hypothetical protein Tco_0206371 [Tanacetum coccineum]
MENKGLEESKDLTSLSHDELIGNLKVHEMIIKKDYEIVKDKGERRSLALKAKKESSDEECSTFGSEDEEYAMAVRDFKRRGRCGDPNHLIGECLKPPKDKNQRAFIGGSCSDSGEEDDEKAKDKTCLVAQASNENETPSGGGLPNTEGGLHKAQTIPKAIKGLPVCSPESEKSVSFQKSILDPRPKHIMICLGDDLEPDEWIKDSGYSKHMMGNRKLFSSYKAYNGVIFGSNLRGNIIGKGQIYDNKCRVTFFEHDSEITKDGKVIGRGIRKKGLYVMKLGIKLKDKFCLATIDENSTLWHRRLAHASHKAKNVVSTTRCLEFLHMDLFGPSAVRNYGGNLYTLVIVDDYSRKNGKLAPRYVGPFEILERIGLVAYRLRLPEELSGVHDTFQVSNLKKCLADASLHVPLDEIKVDKTLRFVEEPVEIMDREVKSLKHSKIALVKVRLNSKRGPEFTWERENYMKSKYP